MAEPSFNLMHLRLSAALYPFGVYWAHQSGGTMASHASSRRHLLRDLPQTYVVLSCAAVAVTLLMFFALYSSPIRRESPVRPRLNDVEIDKQYTGSIMVDPPRGDKCRERILDNRTGYMWDNGYVDCHDVSEPLEKHHPSGIDATRLRNIGKAFRHESN
jgi:hypothetical protein